MREDFFELQLKRANVGEPANVREASTDLGHSFVLDSHARWQTALGLLLTADKRSDGQGFGGLAFTCLVVEGLCIYNEVVERTNLVG